MRHTSYNKLRDDLNSGDLVAFGGTGIISGLIKLGTHSVVSHVGVVFDTKPLVGGDFIVQIIESTSLGDGFAGVQINRMSTRVAQYKGDIWVLKMKEATREIFNEEKFLRWCLDQKGAPYDAPGALQAGLDHLFPDTDEDFSRLYCSELTSGGLQVSGALPTTVNASEETPIDQCKRPIWEEPVQIKGKIKEIF